LGKRSIGSTSTTSPPEPADWGPTQRGDLNRGDQGSERKILPPRMQVLPQEGRSCRRHDRRSHARAKTGGKRWSNLTRLDPDNLPSPRPRSRIPGLYQFAKQVLDERGDTTRQGSARSVQASVLRTRRLERNVRVRVGRGRTSGVGLNGRWSISCKQKRRP
jgi:hypothetical protein